MTTNSNKNNDTTASLPSLEGWVAAYDEEQLTEITKCYCPSCGGSNASSNVLPTKIPMFREIVVMSTSCEDCGFQDSEISFGGTIQEKGERITLLCSNSQDLNRQIIKSDSCTLYIPSVELEIPPNTQRGVISTLEVRVIYICSNLLLLPHVAFNSLTRGKFIFIIFVLSFLFFLTLLLKGILRTAADNLDALQPERLKLGDIDNFHRCRKVIQRLRKMAGMTIENDDDGDEDDHGNGEFSSFEVILDDPAGNSFVETWSAIPSTTKDKNITKVSYFRTPQQDMMLGLQPSQQAMEDGIIDNKNPLHKNIVNVAPGHSTLLVTKTTVEATAAATSNNSSSNTNGIGRQEAVRFDTLCPSCRIMAETNMCLVDIPHFKEVIIMSLHCEACGYKSNEIKGGGAIPKYGTTMKLIVTSKSDLEREILKSDTAGVAIPEIEMEMNEGGLNGVYTTIEGLLDKLHQRLAEANPFGHGDSTVKQHSTNDPSLNPGFAPPKEEHVLFTHFLNSLKELKEGKRFPFTITMSDPLSNSFIGPPPEDAMRLSLQVEREGGSTECLKSYVDPGLTIEEYVRTEEQNEELGLLDMKTENYQQQDEGAMQYYGTDQLEELPDRLRKPEIRGVDHPHAVAKAPVEGDDILMGPNVSRQYAVPSMLQRGAKKGNDDNN
jgi:zinc finger protein